MYEYLKGTLVSIHPTYLVLDVNGLGYQLYAANPFRFQESLQKTLTLYVYQAVREDAITLYGFKNLEEKQLFLKLTSVSGIGPKSALSILAADDNQGLVQAIETENQTFLTKFPGVGKKTAAQIILDLRGKLSQTSLTVSTGSDLQNLQVSSPILSEVRDALLGLGYSEKEIKRVLPIIEKENLSDSAAALKIAFKALLGKK